MSAAPITPSELLVAAPAAWLWKRCVLSTFVSSGVVLLTLATILLLMVYSSLNAPPECESELCNYYAKMLGSTLSDVVQPCHDFHGYVCEGWERGMSISVKTDMYERFIEKIVEKTRNINPPASNQTAVQKAVAFFQSCERTYRGQTSEFATMKEELVKFGVFWPEFSNSSSLVRILLSLSAVWNWGTVVEISMWPTGQFTIAPTRFYEDTLKRRNDMLSRNATGRNFYREYFNKMVSQFGLGRDGGNVLRYDDLMELENIIIPRIREPFMAKTFTTLEKLSIDDLLQNGTISIEKQVWEENIRDLFNLALDSECTFTVVNVEFLRAFFDLVSSEGEPRMAYYIGWAIVQAASLLSNQELITLYYMTEAEAQREHLKFCSGLVHRFMGLPFYAIYTQSEVSPSMIQDVSVLVRTLRESLVHALASSRAPWDRLASALMPNKTEPDKMASPFLLFSEAAEAPLNGLYENFPDMGTSVISNMKLATHGRRLTSEETRMPRFLGGDDARVYYIRDNGFEFLPNALVTPLYQRGAPYAMNYGAIGSEIANAFGEVLLRAVRTLDNDSLPDMYLKPQCHSERRLSEDTKFGEEALALMLEATSLQTLFRQFTSMSDVTLRLRLGIRRPLTEEQVFFILRCYMYCGSQHAKATCNDPLKAFSDFGRAFGCTSRTAMFSKTDCTVTK